MLPLAVSAAVAPRVKECLGRGVVEDVAAGRRWPDLRSAGEGSIRAQGERMPLLTVVRPV